MKRSHLNRRDFHKMAVTALGGVVAGARLARADDKESAKPKEAGKPALLQEPHVCRGLNTCKGKGKGGKNDCAGQSACATAKMISCATSNDCRGLGGCGDDPGENTCKGKGGCHVPLTNSAWAKVRKRFEAEMTKAKKKFGDAPKKT